MNRTRSEFRYVQVRSTRAVVDFSTSGNLEFDYRSPADDVMHLGQSHLTLRVTATKSSAWDFSGGTYGGLGIHTSYDEQKDSIAQNPMSCFFDKSTLYINEKEASSFSNVQASTTALKLCYNTEDEELDNLSPIVPYRHVSDYTSYDTEHNMSNARFNQSDTESNSVNDKTWSGKQRVSMCSDVPFSGTGATGTATIQTFYMAMPINFLTLDDKPIPGNTKIRYSVSVDSQNLLKFLYTRSAHTLTALTVDDFYLNILHERSLSGPPSNLQWTSDYLDVYTHVSDNTNRALPLTVPASSKTVIVSFQKKTVAYNVLRNQHEGIFSLTTQQFLSAYCGFGKTFPNPQYNFLRDLHRAYLDYKLFTLNHSNKSALTFSEWKMSPFLVFHIEDMPENNQTQLVIFTDMIGNAVTDFQIIVNVLYKKSIEIKYNEYSQPEETLVFETK